MQEFNVTFKPHQTQNSPARTALERARAERTEAKIRTIVKSLRMKGRLSESVRVQKSRN